MFTNAEDLQKLSKDTVDATMKNVGLISKTVQTLAAEATDFSKKNFETSADVMGKLLAAKSLDKMIEIQMDFMKSSYEGFVAQATKMGQLYTELAQETSKSVDLTGAGKKAA